MKTKIDVLIIGSGIVGSWVAYYAAKKGLSVAVCEKESSGGDGISGRNSGVLHSGIYYSKNSEKLKHCLRGYDLSLSFFEENNIPYKICGKLITIGKTTQEEFSSKQEILFQLFENGKSNNLSNIEIISKPYLKYKYVVGELAIHIPKTGVVDVPIYLKTLWQLCEKEGVIFLYNRKFNIHNGEYVLEDKQGKVESIDSHFLVNAGGLYSDEIVKLFGLYDYEIRPNKGEYYALKKNLPYPKLIYPLPNKQSTALGVHYTFNLANEAYAGPNSNWANSKSDYTIQTPKEKYYKSLLNILDCYELNDLREGYVGIRPRLFFQEQAIKDFLILEHPKNIVHLLGIESPGLTASPSLGLEVVEKFLK